MRFFACAAKLCRSPILSILPANKHVILANKRVIEVSLTLQFGVSIFLLTKPCVLVALAVILLM